MKRKIFSKLLMGAFLTASVSMFVSCKDYDDDVQDLQTQINSLKGVVDSKESTINSSLSSIQSTLNSLSNLESTLSGKISDGDAATLAAAKKAVEDAIADLNIAALKDALNTQGNDIATLVTANATQDEAIIKAQTAADQALSQITQLQASLEGVVSKEELSGLKEDIAAIKSAVNEIETIKTSLAGVTTDLGKVKEELGTISTDLAKAIGDISELTTALNGQKAAIEALQGKVGNLDLTQALGDIEKLLKKSNEIDAILKKLEGLEATKVAEDLNTINATLKELKAAHANFADKSEVNGIKTNVQGLSDKITTLETSINDVDASINTLTTALAKALRSLVYIPYLYVDGIESIEYPYIRDTVQLKSNEIVVTRQRTTAPYKDDNIKTIRGLHDYAQPAPAAFVAANHERWISPVHPVQYNLNPSRSNTVWGDVLGFDVRGAEVITRSLAAGTVTSPEKYLDGTNVFKNDNGILTVGIKVGDASKLANAENPTEAVGRYEDDIVALQVNTKNEDLEGDVDKTITSDYAMLYPEKVTPEAIVWVLNPKTGAATGINNDEACPWNNKTVHVWDTPQEALGAVNAAVIPDIKLWVDNANGIKLENYLGIHYVNYSKTKKNGANKPGTWNFVDTNNTMAKYGLSYKFELVDYTIDGNASHDSKYCSLDENNGTIIAKNVDADGNTITTSKTAVGREPLVRVLVKQGDDVILDGYILVHITQTEETVTTEDLVVDNYPGASKTYTFCNGLELMNTNWSQFSYYVLTQKLDNLTKEKFDAQYGDVAHSLDGVPELNTTASTALADGGTCYTDVKVYKKVTAADGTVSYVAATAADNLGTVSYKYNANATTNHGFIWSVTEDELEALTHDKTTYPVPVEAYFRFDGKAGAKYENIYVKMTANITRPAINNAALAEKNTNYWFALDGADDGFDAVVFNVNNPVDDGNTRTFSRSLTSTFVGNTFKFGSLTEKAKKFFFLPTPISITAQDGVTYTISTKSTATDETYNAFVCRYGFDAATYTTHKWGTDAENQAILDKCAIDYTKGVFSKRYLYIWKDWGKATASRVAMLAYLAQTTGQISLYYNDYTKLVLNAIGYEANHANINTEMRAWVGAIGRTNTCDVTDIYPNNNFLVSWQRPINFIESEQAVAMDANTNRNYINVIDYLKFYDYRGPVEGKMYGDTQWLWAYYEINKITIDTDPSKVLTNMHQANENNFVKLNTITTAAALGTYNGSTISKGGSQIIYLSSAISGGYTTSYNKASKNADLLKEMGISPVDNAKKQKLGCIYYDNNGDNVEKFKVKIPVTVSYYWGDFTAYLTIAIDRTAGN